MKRARARVAAWLAWRWSGPLLTALVFVGGLVWRWLYLFRDHKPTDFVYFDMGMYVGLAKRFSKEGYALTVYDVMHPPGLSELIAYFYRSDPSLAGLVQLQFVVTALVPLAVGALGWLAFDRASGLWGVAISSLYFPFIDYGGYFLAEIYITLTATVALACYFGAVKLWPERRRPSRWALALAVAAVGGFVFSLSLLMKMVAAPALLCFFGVHVVLTKASKWRVKALVVATMLAAAMPLSVWQADRCTRANEGKFCPGSNKAAADFLMGHIGRVQSVSWGKIDRRGKYRVHSNFGSPAAYQHGYTKKVELPFLITDTEKNKQEAWRFINDNPGQAVVLSFEHVWDSFGGSLPWPTVATRHWAVSQAFHYLFLVFLLFPSMMLLVDVARQRGLVALLRSTELAIFSPILGVIISVMIATGEARYRIPWDMCFILLAVEFYRRLGRAPAPPPAALSPAPEPQKNPPAEAAAP
ncbi:MAG: hypothetical protein IPM79_20325 [Polyangiaceae bacterium]|nr:hypothetical protein [Polyangiaceae bacterium]